MRVVLNKDIPKIGQQGSIITVSDGYARNFLIPRGLASVATKEAHHKLKTQKENLQRK
ncbi:MAG: bL9 family ribosomal protein, partial [bacterium]|nr:bL9 family ribosomal protein [bacterium]